MRSTDFMDQGLCVTSGIAPDAWMPEPSDTEGIQDAIDYCRACPVLDACRAYTLVAPPAAGVMGGEAFGLARQEKRRKAAAAAKKAKNAAVAPVGDRDLVGVPR